MSAAELDLTTCDREPVHLTGAIQPHGALLVLTEPELRLVQVSANTADYFGLTTAPVAGQQLTDIWEPAAVAHLRGQLATITLTGVLAHLLTLPVTAQRSRPLYLFANRSDGLLILECEYADVDTVPPPATAGLLAVRDALQQLQHTTNLAAFLDLLVTQVRALSGFDRVMAYRFAWDGSGEVIAEAVTDGLEPYRGLRYPASDIPAPARRLFACSPLRHIPDVDYIPVPLLPPDPPETDGQPVDLSYSFLRSVSAVHLAYLRNMGSRATLVMPLKQDDTLWGLITCAHHRGPRYLPYEQRVPIEVLTHTAALLLRQREAQEHAAYRARLDESLYQLTELLRCPAAGYDLLLGEARHLLMAVNAGGVALLLDGEVILLGNTPAAPDCATLAAWLTEHAGEPVLATHCLEQLLPSAVAWRAVTAGVLTMRLVGADRIFWFRPEVITAVHWAGDPHKPVSVDATSPERLQPRGSFALWQEEVSGQSLPWLDCERDYATRLRQALLLATAERARLLARLNTELARSNRELDAFAYAASHDLREPLRGIYNFAELLTYEEPTLSTGGTQRLATIRRLASRMDGLLTSLLHYSRASREELSLDLCAIGELAAEAVGNVQHNYPADTVTIRIQPELPTVYCDRMRVIMIFQNLLANALKYNDQPHKVVEIGAYLNLEPPVFFVRDNGIGIAAEHHEVIFGLFRRLHARTQYGGGTGAGLTITKQAIQRHQGQIWVNSTPGEGTTFFFTLAPEPVAVTST